MAKATIWRMHRHDTHGSYATSAWGQLCFCTNHVRGEPRKQFQRNQSYPHVYVAYDPGVSRRCILQMVALPIGAPRQVLH